MTEISLGPKMQNNYGAIKIVIFRKKQHWTLLYFSKESYHSLFLFNFWHNFFAFFLQFSLYSYRSLNYRKRDISVALFSTHRR